MTGSAASSTNTRSPRERRNRILGTHRHVTRQEVIPLTPALGVHTGPGMIGFAAIPTLSAA
jgi:fatty acid-binding protein DegV